MARLLPYDGSEEPRRHHIRPGGKLMNRLLLALMLLGILLAGCSEKTTAPVIHPPAAPRGLFSVTGDTEVTLVWLANTEADVVGYRIYEGPCGGLDCEYTRIAAIPAPAGAEYVEYVVTGLANGATRFFAVAAVNRAGAEGDLSYDDVFDTPRPAGTGLVLNNFLLYGTNVGYDFSAFARTNSANLPTDIFFGFYEDTTGFIHQQIFVPDYSTDIQDAGYVASLDAVDFAPDSESGWSPSGTVEAVVGHAYVVLTRDNHFAKFRVTAAGPTQVTLDWAYQVDAGNRELTAKPSVEAGASQRRPVVWLRR
jgi:hypothetical protein